MRALNGVVIRQNRKLTKIQLESGNVVTTGPVKNIHNGSQVEVTYDFTKNRVRKVWLKGERQSIPQPDEPCDDKVEHPPKIDPSVEAFSARRLAFEGWEEEPGAFLTPLGDDGDGKIIN